jgi:hypothetical protein
VDSTSYGEEEKKVNAVGRIYFKECENNTFHLGGDILFQDKKKTDLAGARSVFPAQE